MEEQLESFTFYIENMALRDQPYMPLFIQDFLTDEKLNECSASATGVYIKIMCLMHKSPIYGTILLGQKHKQTDDQILNFASKFAKLLPFECATIVAALKELIEEDVLQLEQNSLSQKRMVYDGKISSIRSNTGSLGGKKTQELFSFARANDEAKDQAKNEANTEYEYEYENLLKIEKEFEEFWVLYDKKVGSKPKLLKKWAKLKETDKKAIFEYIPKYKLSQPDKQYRLNPETFLNNQSWNNELIYKKGVNGTAIQPTPGYNKSAGRDEVAERLAEKIRTRGEANNSSKV